VNLSKIETTLDQLWEQHRNIIFTAFQEIESFGMLSRAPKDILSQFRKWKWMAIVRKMREDFRHPIPFYYTIYNNWCLRNSAKIQMKTRLDGHRTRFSSAQRHVIGFQPRAPPKSHRRTNDQP
jgi:hypothetical protein